MSDNIKENKLKIKQLRKFIISQLKESTWKGSKDDFENKYIRFRKDSSGWSFRLHHTYNNTSDDYKVSNFLNTFEFWFLRTLYVDRALRNHQKLEKEAKLASLSKKFFDNNKDVLRDNKLDELLNNK
jgi:hypothetical protein